MQSVFQKGLILRSVTNNAEYAANSAKAAKTRSISRLQTVTNPSQNSSISSHSQVYFLECCESYRLNVATVRKVVSIYGKSGSNFGNGKLAILCRRCRPTGGFALVGGERHKGFLWRQWRRHCHWQMQDQCDLPPSHKEH